jgi:hypothetical protein
MLSILYYVYKIWPLRPHCNSSRHVILCRLAEPLLHSRPPFHDGHWCPAKDA